MPPRISSKLTYANVTATLALFVALGGSSWAAITITGKNVRNGSLTGKDIKRNSIGARQVNETRLGPVRKALNLGVDARRGLQVACPGGTLPAAGGCVEARPRPAAGYDSAVLACSGFDATPRVGGDLAHERRLPTHAELRALGSRARELETGVDEVLGKLLSG